jgi:hypothetical protein
LGSSAFARRYWRNHFCFLFLWVLRWFTSPRCPRPAYGFSGGSFGISQREFPHSEIPGSKLICSSPGLIAAYRVLHRLLVPRHSPYTLSSLTIRNSNLRPRSFVSGGQLVVAKPTTRHQHKTTTCVSSMHTACPPSRECAPADECVVGKNYRLQSIQLSKITCCRPPADKAGFATSCSRGPQRPARTSLRNVTVTRENLFSKTIELVSASTAPFVPSERSMRSFKHGGEYRARTGDLLVANQALSQLS